MALDSIQADNPDLVQVVFRHFPLESIHPLALSAAEAAECAGEQGRFNAFHTELFVLQDSLSAIGWAALATRAGVPDTTRFDACVADSTYLQRVRKDMRIGHNLHLAGTPSFFINDSLYFGFRSKAELLQMIRSVAMQPRL
jgi:protein-disulfide isomerase